MEELRRAVARIAATPDSGIRHLPLHHRLLIPFLTASSLLLRCLSPLLRHLTRRHRLPVGVISVGNLTWGGNGKTPMVEFLARRFEVMGINPLILTRGYAGGDETRMLQRRVSHTRVKIAEGVKRASNAAYMLNKFGYVTPRAAFDKEYLVSQCNSGSVKIGLVILDDGMQHWSLLRDVEIVMINGLMPWGNKHLIPRGSLREPLNALLRADIIVIHHANLATDVQLRTIETIIEKNGGACPIYFSKLVPVCIFHVQQPSLCLPLRMMNDINVLCVSAIGYPDAFAKSVEENGAKYVDRLDFSDHHCFNSQDIELIRERVRALTTRFSEDFTVMVTEKDYDRDPAILGELQGLRVWVLSCTLQIMPLKGLGEVELMVKLKELLIKT